LLFATLKLILIFVYELILLAVSLFGGFLGAIMGLGGGIIIVPVLTLVLHIDIRYAIAASLLSVVATSSGAAAGFLKDRLTNLRLAVLLEVGTVLGAITGFLISKNIRSSYLFLLFSFFLFLTAISMLRKRDESKAIKNHPWAEKLKLDGHYPEHTGEEVYYPVANVPVGLSIMYVAGVLSALLGIGSGIFKVSAMDGVMKLPIKVSSATSNFMIGVTATASAGAYMIHGQVRPEIACPMAIGIIAGSWMGARAMGHIPAQLVRKFFVVILIVVSVQMLLKGLGHE
jgi:uncharacterized membrane protein YfcA